jgi:hypothetical protein
MHTSGRGSSACPIGGTALEVRGGERAEEEIGTVVCRTTRGWGLGGGGWEGGVDVDGGERRRRVAGSSFRRMSFVAEHSTKARARCAWRLAVHVATDFIVGRRVSCVVRVCGSCAFVLCATSW